MPLSMRYFILSIFSVALSLKEYEILIVSLKHINKFNKYDYHQILDIQFDLPKRHQLYYLFQFE